MRSDLTFGTLEATLQFADLLASQARPGLTVLLDGPVGAGKTTLARRLIQSCLRNAGAPVEDVPSPTFTIVQTYDAGPLQIWHADLYRLGSPSELQELGLEAAFETAFCIVEWPDRMGDMAPDALHLEFSYGAEDDTRHCRVEGSSNRFDTLIATLAKDHAG